MKLYDLCAELKNWFDTKRSFGVFTVKGGSIVIPDMLTDQYFRIVGSVFNDGVYKYPATGLKDEEFDGAIWYMAVPPDVLNLVDAMTQWETQNADILNSPYNSESFGGYSYTRASGGSAGTGGGSSAVMAQFASQLKRYRKARGV